MMTWDRETNAFPTTVENFVSITGINHRFADVAMRERAALDQEHIDEVAHRLSSVAKEVLILSTCNRTEIYTTSDHADKVEESVVQMFSNQLNIPSADVGHYLYTYRQAGAVRHLFAVASGLDSLVQGETQILAQVKTSMESAQHHGTVGCVLSQLFRDAISVGKEARSMTRFGRINASVSQAAVSLVQQLFQGARPEGVLVIGAGKAASLAIEALFKSGLGPVLVTNRTYEAAYALTRRIGGRAIPFDNMAEVLGQTDVVISATAAPHLVLRRPLVEAAMAARNCRPLHLIDIAVPRDIEPSISQLANVHLYDIDTLQTISPQSLGASQCEADRVWEIVGHRTTGFMDWLDSRQTVPTIVALRQRAERIRQEELREALSKLKTLDADDRQTVEALTTAIVNKLLHQPIIEVKRGNNGWSRSERLLAAQKLFGLTEESTSN